MLAQSCSHGSISEHSSTSVQKALNMNELKCYDKYDIIFELEIAGFWLFLSIHNIFETAESLFVLLVKIETNVAKLLVEMSQNVLPNWMVSND